MAETTMNIIQFSEYGRPEVLHAGSVARPEPAVGEVLVRVRATGVHPFDTKLRGGQMQAFMPILLPHTPGIDFAGVVEVAGSAVSGLAAGDPVYGRGGAAYAEYVVAKPEAIARKPESIGFEEAATVPVGAGTAWTALDAAGVEAGQHVLIHGGAGGVGMFAVQLAHRRGARVSATTSTANVDFVRGLGADEVIDYTTSRFDGEVSGLDAVIDTVGGEVLERSWPVLKKGGILVTIAGQPSEEAAAAHGVRATAVQGSADRTRLDELARLIDDGAITVQVATVFPLSAASAAHALSETGHGRGRIVLRVSEA